MRGLPGLALLGILAGLAAVPRRRGPGERLAAFPRDGLPLRRPVLIHWDEHLVPFIEAEEDGDLAVALGLVHAHLRLGQMELWRRAGRGRLCEMVGPAALGFDHLLRLLDFGRAVPAMAAAPPQETRGWLAGFVAGVNHALRHLNPLPEEFRLFGLAREPWSIEDVLILSRLTAADVTWLVWFHLLGTDHRRLWGRLWDEGAQTVR